MFNPDIQYRCTIIRGKAQRELDNLLPAYANIVSEICPCAKEEFHYNFNNNLSELIYQKAYEDLSDDHQKTIRNHITEIAGKLFGLFFEKDEVIYESQTNAKLLEDNDQPAFFKNLCLKFQFPNGTQKINTIQERLDNKIAFKPFHFILALLNLAQKQNVTILKDEIAYYILNAKQVLQGIITPETVLGTILYDREKKVIKRLKNTSFNTQHIREQLNLLTLANLVGIDKNAIYLNNNEQELINYFIQELDKPLNFNIYEYDLSNEKQKKQIYLDWAEYFGQISTVDSKLLRTRIQVKIEEDKLYSTTQKINTTSLGDQGEEFIFNLEKERVAKTHPRLVNKIQLVGKLRGLGYDILSVEASENKEEPEFARFIEVKSTMRTTEPDLNDITWLDTVNLTRKEWIAAKQYGSAYNIYRVYFTPNKVVVRKINNPFYKHENGIVQIIPTVYRMDFTSKSIDFEY